MTAPGSTAPGRIVAVVWLSALTPLTGCGPVLVGGALGFDAGTLGVSGVETGVGAQAEIIAFDRDGSSGVGPAVQLAGYSSSGDGDPIAFTTLEARYAGWNPFGGGAYLEVGTGLGAAWSPGVHHAAVPVQVEVGLERPLGAWTGRVGVRERFIGLIGGGSPPLEAFNAVQLVLGVTLGGGGSDR